ncbi:KIN17-like protein [Schizosaccharomyces pombe]
MGRAEAGTPKAISNALKSKGLQRLRWYCSACQKQMRDENGFKCHTQSEGHIRQMNVIAMNPGKRIQDFSNQFLRDFISLLRTAHGEKKIHFNQFYQEYIRDKNHVHMNATRWHTLSEFCKFLGRQGMCRVEENEKGFFISYIDKNPANILRNEANKKRERQEKSDEEQRLRLLDEQIKRAYESAQNNEDNKDRSSREQPVLHEIDLSKKGNPIQLNLSSSSDSHSAQNEFFQTRNTPTFSFSSSSSQTSLKHKPKNVFAELNKSRKKNNKDSLDQGQNVKRPRSAVEDIIAQETMREKRRNIKL